MVREASPSPPPARLPSLREELALHEGPILPDGQPSWTLHDPARNKFFRIDWPTFSILSHWSIGNPAEIALAVASETTLQSTAEDVLAVAEFLGENQLLQPRGSSAPEFARRLATMRGSFATRLLHNYLFFRIPLWKPDAWLARHVHRADMFWSANFVRATLVALLIGLFQVSRDWDRFTATLVDTLSWDGLLAYGLALVAIKFAHELGHAFTAKRYGCRVPTMGVAFLVLWPMAYTDTNESWKLAERRQRFAVAAAGLRVELTVAAWSLGFWAFLPEGAGKSIAFVLATTALVATLAINASPFMRFDGYFLLSDWLDMPNLHERSFALGRWHLRERLFALGDSPPEVFSKQKTRWMILFAWATWIYRLLLFLGIAVLVYHFFIKAIGILLFVVEMVWFIALPIGRELAVWHKRWPQIRHSHHARRSGAIALALLLLLVIPWPSRVNSSAILRPAEMFPVHAPAHAQVQAMPYAHGQPVEAGAALIALASPEIELRQQTIMARVERLRWLAAAAGLDPEQRARQPVLLQELAAAEAQWQEVLQEQDRYQPKAPFAGRLYDIHPDLRPGMWLQEREQLAVLVKEDTWLVETYLDESAVRRIAVGDSAHFYTDTPTGKVVALTVSAIDQDATRQLPNDFLVTHAGGALLARSLNGVWVPEQALYRVVFTADGAMDRLNGHTWRGKVVIAGSWEAPGLGLIRSILTVLRREAGF